MDWTVCRRCGLRYLATEPACPSCPAGNPAAAPVPRATPVQRAAARADRDVPLFVLHVALGTSVLWTVARHGRPLWALVVAALELGLAIGALTRWRCEPVLIHLRAGLYASAAVLLFHAGVLNAFMVAVVLAHVTAVWAARRIPARGVAVLAGAYFGLRSSSGALEDAARDRAGAEVRFFVRLGALAGASFTGLLLVAVLLDVARGVARF